jgi:hypothetical protein
MPIATLRMDIGRGEKSNALIREALIAVIGLEAAVIQIGGPPHSFLLFVGATAGLTWLFLNSFRVQNKIIGIAVWMEKRRTRIDD